MTCVRSKLFDRMCVFLMIIQSEATWRISQINNSVLMKKINSIRAIRTNRVAGRWDILVSWCVWVLFVCHLFGWRQNTDLLRMDRFRESCLAMMIVRYAVSFSDSVDSFDGKRIANLLFGFELERSKFGGTIEAFGSIECSDYCDEWSNKKHVSYLSCIYYQWFGAESYFSIRSSNHIISMFVSHTGWTSHIIQINYQRCKKTRQYFIKILELFHSKLVC